VTATTQLSWANDALALAPVKSGDEHELVTSFVRFEAMPRDALEKGISWGWHSYRDYLDSLEGRLGINVGGLVGHIPLRHFVMGQETADRPAKPAEIQRMKQLVAQALEGGALGFSTNRNERHMRGDGKSIPSGLADDEEFFTLCDALGELNAGVIQSHLGQVDR
jgi:N-acyl-D-amino-acid deacylase